jgi:twinkle protein
MIVHHDQIVLEVKDVYAKGGLPRGASTGWPSIDQLYTVGMAQWTLVTGHPNSGKSEWVDALMVNLARREKWRFVIYSPENWPLAVHHSKIIEKYIGKPFNPGPTERLDEVELDEAEEWMRGKFLFAKPDRPDMATILTEAAKFAAIGDTWKLGVVIDPWNHLEHYRPQFMSETEYVSDILSQLIQWVRETRAHVWLIAHPAKMAKDKDGRLPIPTPHDVSGSAHFWSKCDAAVTVWRNQSKDVKSSEVEIHVMKVRFKHIGRQGMARLDYDLVTGRYREQLVPMENVRGIK